ncbi:MAG: FkbM family methyltransferase [Bacteroidetes bacterium]|nr:FkbM family methyltransferase [Bacteroidota bacterium]
MMLHSTAKLLSDGWSTMKGLYWDKALRSFFDIPVRRGMSFRFARYGDVARMLYMQSHLVRFGKSFETEMLDLFCSRLTPGATVIDVGANVGMYAMAASRLVGPQGRVLAYEPDPVTYAALCRNLEMNGCANVRAFPLALSDRAGWVSLSVPDVVQARFTYGDSYHSMTPVAEGVEGGIECVALDDHLAGLGIACADVMKVDVEGAELSCLRGASGLLSAAGHPFLMLECDEALCARFGHNVFHTLSFLAQQGYMPEQIAAHDWVAHPSRLQS